ncbi:MAG: hypothetical protein GTN62_08270 [Gemmatimonadales bacterium]|nr:hypothetical protein [Gemmatimonadales bacterium]NIN50095.1 hypothetical protein [Gemmatimonadales bacterium]NIP07559.1 hypothetical protein [Gemmatimonadales bacterium]NIR01715.1 hypothetical protein [Gemmatimonadales bacterium]NIS65618.1 hypothetical protein [Gemmatimonadales bacterium]
MSTARRHYGMTALSRRLVRWGAAIGGVTAALTVLAAPLDGQSIAERVRAAGDGQVRMSFTAREGVCGNGRNISTHRSTSDWESWCEPGPVRVAIDVEGGTIVDIDTYVGGRWRPRRDATDLGSVPAPEAAEYLLSLAARLEGRPSKEAILPATLADSAVVWPQLLDIAKNEDRPQGTRKSAVFWVAQAAGEATAEGLEDLAVDESGDFEVRKSAIFALSQLRDDQGVPILIRIARTNTNPRLRKQAIFWLGQSHDPRALALFEELLTKP